MRLRRPDHLAPWTWRLFLASLALLLVAVGMWLGGALVLGGWKNHAAINAAGMFWLRYAQVMDMVVNVAIGAAVLAMVAQVAATKK